MTASESHGSNFNVRRLWNCLVSCSADQAEITRRTSSYLDARDPFCIIGKKGRRGGQVQGFLGHASSMWYEFCHLMCLYPTQTLVIPCQLMPPEQRKNMKRARIPVHHSNLQSWDRDRQKIMRAIPGIFQSKYSTPAITSASRDPGALKDKD
jgi:hypothetical protein